MTNDESKYSSLSDRDICELLKKEDGDTWRYVLEKIVDQEKRSSASRRKCRDWNVSLDALISRLYDEMVGGKKLETYTGGGSIFGWLRKYLRGYLNRECPSSGREVSLDTPMGTDDGEKNATLADIIPSGVSEFGFGCTYGGEDDQVLLRERRRIARRCFRELWLGNSMQAYVMLLKTRFQMSSLEIKERLGASSADNVDQMFARAIRKMREVRERYED